MTSATLAWQTEWLTSEDVEALRDRQVEIAQTALEAVYCPALSAADCRAMLNAALAQWAIGPASVVAKLTEPSLVEMVIIAANNRIGRRAGVILYRAPGMEKYSVGCAATTRNAVKLIGEGAIYIEFAEGEA